MPLAFHHEDRPPQLWLDELYRMSIPRLWEVNLNATQRANLMARAKQQLKDWRTNLREQTKKIEARYNKDSEREKELMLAPYKKLDHLSIELIDAMQDLEARVAAKRPIPEGFEIGYRIFGDLDTGRWFFGANVDAKRWEEFEKLERRFLGLRKEYQRVGNEVKVAFDRAKDFQEQLNTAEKRLKQRKSILGVILRFLVVFIMVGICLGLGGFLFTLETPLFENGASNQVFGGILLVMGVVGVLIAYVLHKRRRKAIAELEADVAHLKVTLADMQKEARRQKQLFYPTEQTYKEVGKDYQKMKASFK